MNHLEKQMNEALEYQPELTQFGGPPVFEMAVSWSVT